MNHLVLNIPKLKESTAERHVILKKINYYLEDKKITLRIFSSNLEGQICRGEVDYRDPLFRTLDFLLRNKLEGIQRIALEFVTNNMYSLRSHTQS